MQSIASLKALIAIFLETHGYVSHCDIDANGRAG